MGESDGVRSRGGLPIALRVLLVLGFLIALAATGLVVFADDVKMLRLAAVLALWAALIAAFAVTRSRRDAKAAVMRESEAQLAYQLELHREVAARREYEADLSRQVAAAQSDQLAELREQLDQLTGVLSSLAGGELTVSRLTLSAESARFSPGDSRSTVRGTVAGARTVAGNATAGRVPGELVGPRTADTNGAPDASADGVADGRLSGWVRPEAPAAAWATRHADWVQTACRRGQAEAVTDHRAIADAATGGPESGDSEPSRPEESEADEAEPDAADGADDAEPGDHESGVSVADLVAAYGLSGRSRRRRRG